MQQQGRSLVIFLRSCKNENFFKFKNQDFNSKSLFISSSLGLITNTLQFIFNGEVKPKGDQSSVHENLLNNQAVQKTTWTVDLKFYRERETRTTSQF